MHTRSVFVLVATLCLVLLVSSTGALTSAFAASTAPPRYTLTRLSARTSSVFFAFAAAIDARGDVVATSAGGSTVYWPANAATHPTRLVDVNGAPVTNLSSVAMNDRREIVSTQAVYRGCCTLSNALFWRTPQSRPTRLQGGRVLDASGINDAGIIVGSTTVMNTTLAVRWVGGIPHVLPHAGMPESYAAAINQHGAIAGAAFAPQEDSRAVFWPPNGAPRVLAPSRFADALNNQNDVVGQGALFGQSAWIWHDGHVSDLPNPPSDYPVTQTVPTAINNNADITGLADTTNPYSVVPEAVVWHDGTGYRLQDLLTKPTRLNLTQALAINNAGWIVAQAYGSALPFPGVVLLRPVD